MHGLPISRGLFRWPASARKCLFTYFQSVGINWRISRRLRLELSLPLEWKLIGACFRCGINYYTRLEHMGRRSSGRSRSSRGSSSRRRRTEMVQKQNYESYGRFCSELFDDCSTSASSLRNRPHWVVYVRCIYNLCVVCSIYFICWGIIGKEKLTLVAFIPAAGNHSSESPTRKFPWASYISLAQVVSHASQFNSSVHYNKQIVNLTQRCLSYLSDSNLYKILNQQTVANNKARKLLSD